MTTLTPAQIARMTAMGTPAHREHLGGDWTVTDTVRSAHVLAAVVANDDFHGALSNVIRGAGARIWENLEYVGADDVDRFAAHVEGSTRYGTDAADRARIVGELRAIADYMREYVDPFAPDRCVVCGDVVDYCQGHGSIGDPDGAAVLRAHDDEDHTRCHPAGCDDAQRAADAADAAAHNRGARHTRGDHTACSPSLCDAAHAAAARRYVVTGDRRGTYFDGVRATYARNVAAADVDATVTAAQRAGWSNVVATVESF
ncbi:hypothetical protein KNU78_gp82 [Gordonia phage Sukkupi]|uniref:Uncharacterized protein n=1 Tax=Gordonia phage Sukkupi TaxID=2653747 RepID=A0A5Q2WJ32_9CAUD|nr:hypothetical protein KNU78_gp82 [Gordonia phage Sukkupi]QGH79325.1 hypothetical protein SEA_SUKKUPI_82 [Gordonia phage Sukkupi]QGH80797.1 hypothetical protein SEA_YNDEXA_82 [Gordonia phage Yndexa]